MYGKIFEQIFDGTLATKGPWQALVTFEQLIILADKHGTVDMTPEAIARRTTIPLEIIQVGLAALEQPDPESRTPDDEGRRIVRLSDSRTWGWRVVNHDHYRKIRSEEERREYHKLYQRDRRAKKKAVNSGVNTSTAHEQNQPIARSSMQEAVCRKQNGKRPKNLSPKSAKTREAGQVSLIPDLEPIPKPETEQEKGHRDWEENVCPIRFARYMAAIKPFVDKYGWADVIPVQKVYRETREGLAMKVEWMVGDAVRLIRLSKQGLTNPLTDMPTERGLLVDRQIRRSM